MDDKTKDQEQCKICGQPKVFRAEYSEQSDEVMEGMFCENPNCGKVQVKCPMCKGRGFEEFTEPGFTIKRRNFCLRCMGTGKVWQEKEREIT